SFDLTTFAAFDPSNSYDRVVIFYDFGNGGQGTTFYFDDIQVSAIAGPAGDEPVAAAPSPTMPSANVISLFSDAYTNVPVDTWRTGWSDATLEEVSINGNAVKKYS